MIQNTWLVYKTFQALKHLSSEKLNSLTFLSHEFSHFHLHTSLLLSWKLWLGTHLIQHPDLWSQLPELTCSLFSSSCYDPLALSGPKSMTCIAFLLVLYSLLPSGFLLHHLEKCESSCTYVFLHLPELSLGKVTPQSRLYSSKFMCTIHKLTPSTTWNSVWILYSTHSPHFWTSWNLLHPLPNQQPQFPPTFILEDNLPFIL